LKGALGLDHFEGRGFGGWHHHVTLVSGRARVCDLERLRPKSGGVGLTLWQLLGELQILLACWGRRLPPVPASHATLATSNGASPAST
jgi:hypothetical protein